MKVFLYSSPYQYYADNLIPLAKYLKSQSVEVYGSFRLSENGLEMNMLCPTEFVNYSNRFLQNKLTEIDVVILTQPWWYMDCEIAAYCRKHKIMFYIVDHAPPMMRYTETIEKKKKSHLYRSDLKGAGNFFAYGKATVDVMREVGCKSSMKIMGSSRIEAMLPDIIRCEKEGFVLFDTSKRMEDKSLVKPFFNFVKHNPDKKFIIREHSRSSKIFSQKASELKYSNIEIGNNLSEIECYQYSDFIFTFPSSAMIAPAICKKKIYTLYKNHYCLEAKQYYKKYSNLFLSLGDNYKDVDYSVFLTNNLLYKENESTNQRLYHFLQKEVL